MGFLITLLRNKGNKEMKNLLKTTAFDKIYALTAVILFAIALVAEGAVSKTVRYSPYVLVGLAYLYYTIRFTLFRSRFLPHRLLGQTFALTAVAILLTPVVEIPMLIPIVVLPLIFLFCLMLMAIYTLYCIFCAVPYRRHLINLFIVSLLTFIPFIANMIIYGFVDESDGFSLVVAGLGFITIILMFAIKPKIMVSELKKVFHF